MGKHFKAYVIRMELTIGQNVNWSVLRNANISNYSYNGML